MIDVQKEIVVHLVPEAISGWVDVHSHGLSRFGYPELRIGAQLLFAKEAGKYINIIADHILNSGQNIENGHVIEFEGNYMKLVMGRPGQFNVEAMPLWCAMCSEEIS